MSATMAAQVETAAPSPPPPPPSTALTQEDRERLREFDRIVQFRDSVTSGKHPRIKIPAHLLRVARTSSADPQARAAPTQRSAHPSEAPPLQRIAETQNSLAHQKNSETSSSSTWAAPTAAPAAGAGALPGLGFAAAAAGGGGVVKKPGTFDPVLLEKSDSLVRAEFALKRARIETRLREQADDAAKADDAKAGEEQAIGLDLGDVLQKARELERTFTPPPGVAAGAGEANQRGDAAAAARGDSADDDDDDGTFYSSKFSTPEFGLKARAPAAAAAALGNDADAAASVADSSDYEPEIDGPPALAALSQPQLAQGQAPAQAQAPPPFYAQGNAAPWSGAPHPQWESSLSGLSRGFPSTDSGPLSSGASSYQRPPAEEGPRPPSPFIHRAHDLSPVAPQPSHASSLAAVAAVAQLPLGTPGQQQQQPQQPYFGLQRAPPQVALLRKEETSHSSAESSQPDRGSGAGDKRKGKKQQGGSNKRKADRPASPRIKVEARSESPVLLPAVQRPHKRQRQAERMAERQAARQARRAQEQAGLRHDDPYSPTLPQAPATDMHGAAYHPSQPARNDRMPVVYEEGAGGFYEEPPRARPTGGPPRYPRQPQRAYEVYETVPVYAQATRPPSVGPEYVPARLHRQPYVEAPPAAGGYQYEPPRHAGVQEYSTSPVLMAPPPASRVAYRRRSPPSPPPPPQAHIVTDEYGHEYYEPGRPAVRQGPPAATAPGGGAAGPGGGGGEMVAVVHPRYEAEAAVYERPLSRQRYVLPPQQQRLPARAVSQMPPALYEERSRGGYGGKTSPVFVAPARRVLTQPEYVTQDALLPPGYAREYSVVRASQPPQPPPPPYYAAAPTAAHPSDGGYGYHPRMARAATAVPHDAYSPYEAIPAAADRYGERVGGARPPEAMEETLYSQRPPPPLVAPPDGRVYVGGGGVHGPYEGSRREAGRAMSVLPGPGPGPGQPRYYVERPAPGEGYADDAGALYR